jgi:cytidine deaminase
MHQNHPELLFGLVRAIGTDVDPVISGITSLLQSAQFSAAQIQLSARFPQIGFIKSTLKSETEDQRYKTYMNGGDLLRSATQRGDAAAVLGMMEVRDQRAKWLGDAVDAHRGRAYILKSLMHPGELTTLRRVYGAHFFGISIFAPRDARVRRLAKRIADSWGEAEELYIPKAEEFANRDVGINDHDDEITKIVPAKFALDVQKTFHRADLFISATAPEDSAVAIRRFVELIFGHPFHTPTREEFGMCMAFGASLRSSSLGRGVGAAILTPSGDVVSVGSNEAPRFGGGQYWPGDKPDGRTFVSGYDTSDRIRRQIFADLIRRLYVDRAWAKDQVSEEDQEVLDRVLKTMTLEATIEAILKSDTTGKARILDVIEYIREVHAEMATITDAAKRGVSVKGCVLYCTAFPCHECARLIVSAGITRVVYIEPYPKSRVAELYADSIGLADRHTDLGQRVRFEPFVGISPRRYFELFSSVPRKAADLSGACQDYKGTVAPWSIGTASLRETICDSELLNSGARNQSILCAESHHIRGFEARLAELMAAETAMMTGEAPSSEN